MVKYDNKGNYRFLPKNFRDFDDQEDLFKSIYKETDYKNREVKDYYKVPYPVLHTNVVDVFLFQMALRGYTLQRDDRFIGENNETSRKS